MRIILFSLAFLGLTSMGFAQEKGIIFEKEQSWEQIKAKAKSENKYIFMDIFATWCKPCKIMDKDVYPDERLGSFMNSKFISVKVQTDLTKEDKDEIRAWFSEAKRIMVDCHINGYPSFLFFSSDGKLVNRGLGFKNVNALIELGTESLDPNQQYYSKIERFKLGKLAYNQMPELAKKAQSFDETILAQNVADIYVNNYLLKLDDLNLFTKEHLNFIGSFLGTENSKGFKLFMKEPEKVNAILGAYQAQGKIMDFIDRKYLPQGNFEKIDKPDWNALEEIVVRKFGDLGKERVYGQRMLYHWVVKDDWQRFGKYYVLYFEKALKHTRFQLNNMSWSIFEHINDEKTLEFAVKVMKYDLENFDQNDPAAYDTYANLLYKIGKKEEALKWEQHAIKLSNSDKEFVEILEKMKKNERTWVETAINP